MKASKTKITTNLKILIDFISDSSYFFCKEQSREDFHIMLLNLACFRIWLLLLLIFYFLFFDTTDLKLSPHFFRRSVKDLSFSLVAWTFSMSGSIMIWCAGPSAGVQFKPMGSCKFYLMKGSNSINVSRHINRINDKNEHINRCRKSI